MTKDAPAPQSSKESKDAPLPQPQSDSTRTPGESLSLRTRPSTTSKRSVFSVDVLRDDLAASKVLCAGGHRPIEDLRAGLRRRIAVKAAQAAYEAHHAHHSGEGAGVTGVVSVKVKMHDKVQTQRTMDVIARDKPKARAITRLRPQEVLWLKDCFNRCLARKDADNLKFLVGDRLCRTSVSGRGGSGLGLICPCYT